MSSCNQQNFNEWFSEVRLGLVKIHKRVFSLTILHSHPHFWYSLWCILWCQGIFQNYMKYINLIIKIHSLTLGACVYKKDESYSHHVRILVLFLVDWKLFNVKYVYYHWVCLSKTFIPWQSERITDFLSNSDVPLQSTSDFFPT